MAFKKRKSIVPPREDVRKRLTRSTGAKAITYLNRSLLHETLEKPAAKKILQAADDRAAAYRAMRVKRRRAALARVHRKAAEEAGKTP